LIEARVSNPEAQRAVQDWQQRQVELQGQRQQLERETNPQLMQRLLDQEASQFRIAEDLIGRYPEIAELLETRPADLERLQAGIPAGTMVLQPAPLTGVPKRADTMALFALTRTDLQVVTVPLPQNYPALVETYRQQLEKGEAYLERSQQLYDLLIRPLEDRGLLPAGGRLAVIATGKLRDIPFETLYDGRTKQYLLEKYPIHYLTRLSRNGAPAAQLAGGGSAQRALVLANPTPTARELPGTEAEANYLVGAFAGSRDLRRGQATLEQFQQQASRYPILHLGTHGCFVATGCPDLGMKANTLLFANRQQYPIAQAAQLGLSNTELLVLGACQTAQTTSDTDVGVSGLAYVWERAGARAVVASLWSAADAESAQITKAFYGNLKAGMDKAEAMRQAKLALLRPDPDGLHPYLWAPFIVIGDAAPLKGPPQSRQTSP
jgi:CHAT domain-containing protein